jgi:hypothetical protein
MILLEYVELYADIEIWPPLDEGFAVICIVCVHLN